MTTGLIIGDLHASPDYDNRRFDALGHFILDRKPDLIIQMGDWADMGSLSSYDRGKASFEGRRYERDVEAVKDSLRRLEAPVAAYNAEQAKKHKERYRPRKHVLLGNHEARILAAAQSRSELQGKLSIKDLGFEDHGWEVHQFLKPVNLYGICFRHFKPTQMGRAMGGDNLARMIVTKGMESQVVGHSHCLDFSRATSDLGRDVFCLVAGCYVHPDFDEPWAAGTDHVWWRGVHLLHGLGNGTFTSREEITMQDIEARYGGR